MAPAGDDGLLASIMTGVPPGFFLGRLQRQVAAESACSGTEPVASG